MSIQDWWTTGRVALRVGPGIAPADITLARINDSLVLRTQDGLDRLVLEGYLGLIPDASTLRIIFSDGSEWTGADLIARLSTLDGREFPRATEPAFRGPSRGSIRIEVDVGERLAAFAVDQRRPETLAMMHRQPANPRRGDREFAARNIHP